jgi:hypothetical protein
MSKWTIFDNAEEQREYRVPSAKGESGFQGVRISIGLVFPRR